MTHISEYWNLERRTLKTFFTLTHPPTEKNVVLLLENIDNCRQSLIQRDNSDFMYNKFSRNMPTISVYHSDILLSHSTMRNTTNNNKNDIE